VAEKGKEESEEPMEESVEARWCREHGPIEEPVEEKGRLYCPECHKILAKEKPEETPEETEETEEEETGVPPPQVETRNRILKLLKERLPTVYGISSKRASAIIETLESNPEMLDNMQTTYYHIRQIAGKNLNDYMLNMTLQGIYNEVGYPQQVAPPILPTSPQGQQAPPFFAPQQPSGFGYQPMAQHAQMPQPTATSREKEREEIETLKDERQRRQEKHDLEMGKLKEELRSKGEKSEPTVEVPTDEGTIEVPASQAVYHMQMQMLNRRIEEAEKPEEKVTIPMGEEETAEVPVSQAPYMMQTQWAQAERKRMEKEYERLRKSYDDLRDRLNEAVSEKAEAESPSYSLIRGTKEDFEEKADRFLRMIEGGELPRTRRSTAPAGPRYTPEERERKEREISERIERAEERADYEDEFLKASKELAEEQRGG